MSDYDWQLSAGAPPCVVSDSFYRIVRETIFQHLTKETTAEQWQAAQESLTRLRDELQQAIRPMHYGSLVGGHRCLDHIFREAAARLRNLELMQPPPPDPPEPPPPRETLDAVVRDLRDKIQPNPQETTLGTDEPIREERQHR
jgi:hypothetical protein